MAPHTDKTVFILGATGGIGGAVARVALGRGWKVRALVRDPQKAGHDWRGHDWRGACAPEWVRGDAMVQADVVGAAAGVAAIVHAVNPPGYRNWPKAVLPMIHNTIAAARAANGARIVLPGTLYNYDPRIVPRVDETTPQQPRGRKGRIRVELEQSLAAAAPDVPSLVVRAGDFFGSGARQTWFTQALAKPPLQRIVAPGRDGVGHAWAYLPDLAEAMVRLLELPPGALAAAERVQFAGFWDADGSGMAAAIRRATGRPDLPVKAFPWWLMRLLAPLGGFPREVLEVQSFWRHPMRLDNARLVRLLGEEPGTPLDQAVATTLQSMPR
ncbi:NAD(P)H-binding protein [Aureimonas leprariae]|uniref:NAD(P)H-binding protein n=1 Tax=Plantimonas leprariae TaxID=2615207 RepID=A0A7V7PLG5_9HYPH|nr:NAD(P)H-binding protein [Aureimonas leprariae]KAB0677244.1 NAD(P)H-binding protein [Aureimonas leprariae]